MIRILWVLVASASCDTDVTKILFGSCNLAHRRQPMWQQILAREPDLWIWGGDNIYADQEVGIRLFPPGGIFQAASPARLQRIYEQQLSHPDYSAFLAANVPIIGTWDDHDFGINDGDATYPHRNESRQMFLDFIGEPTDSFRRRREGVYESYVYDFGHGEAGRKVLVVLLDLRFNKDPYGTLDGDFLGEDQWRWLNSTLAASSCDVTIIVSSLQFLQGRPVLGENWNRFPAARQRFLRLLAQHNVSSPVVLSGDVHLAEMALGSSSGGRLWEITSSGMTHSWDAGQPEQGERGKAFANFAHGAVMTLAQLAVPWRYQMISDGQQQYFLGKNFGELQLDWHQRRLTAIIRDEEGQPQLQQAMPFAEMGLSGEVEDFGPYRGEAGPLATGLGMVLFAVLLLLPVVVALCCCCGGGYFCYRRCVSSKDTEEQSLLGLCESDSGESSSSG